MAFFRGFRRAQWLIEAQGRAHCRTQSTVAQTRRAGLYQRPIDRAAQQTDEGEIIEMARLERCILAVVGEAEQFSLVRANGWLAVHPA